MSIVELIVVCAVLVVIMAALSNVFVSGLRASTDGQARLTAQENVRTALDRLEYEARCAETATLVSGGAGVHLHLQSQCPHATGDLAWCVNGGVLERIAGGTDCTGTAQSFVSNVTSATPFACVSPEGALPRLQVSLSVNTSGGSSDGFSAVDEITLRNATYTTGGVSQCT